ncbi:MAG: histidine kinase [Flavobacteriaceae bacterium]|nr:histidine kinase [Flavobacteriaceae bacterium]
MDTEGTTVIIIITTLMVILLVVVIIVIFSIFQNRKMKFLLEKRADEIRFEEEIIKSQLETQEQTLQNISWELHDNVGQLLSVAKMQLNMLQPNVANGQKGILLETGDIIAKSLQEIRTLSKLLNPETVKNMGLQEAIELELQRFNRMNFLDASLHIEGDQVNIDQKDEIILFRILQEFLSNSIKHARAKSLIVNLSYHPDKLIITAKDSGVGFDEGEVAKGSGLINMQSRAKLIGADFSIESKKNKGVTLTLAYPLKKEYEKI